MSADKKLTTLVVMAAGIGSRFGGGIKQLEPVGPSGEIIIDYSVFDAVEAGFNRVMFIIRHDIEKDFKERIGYKIEEKLGKENVFYAYQETNIVNKKFSDKASMRTKPFGTGHAVLMCRGALNTPFAVINADDYYGKEAYKKVHDYLVSSDGDFEYCMAGFRLGNTLSDNGGVTRGICSEDENGNMIKCVETKEIKKFGDMARAGDLILDPKVLCSMNMWGLKPSFLDILEEGFSEFLEGIEAGDNKSEYLLPTIIGNLLDEKKINVKVLPTEDTWFGVTFKEDKEFVKESFKKLISEGVYSENLYGKK
ncbi:MAG: nucleotidyltransferase [Ruminococcaceae bacterium]|nr:nucleotidyltransferase [Oscillospiraceae bacterium]